MKKILIGICGIGNGHINRQSCIIEELLKKGEKVLVVTTDDKIKILEKRFSNLKILKIFIPWIICNEKGIDYSESLKIYKKKKVNLYTVFLELCKNIEEFFDGKPDIVISDYEPNVAQYAYSSNVPIITMEQQSKYLYLKELKIKNFSIKEEQYRLNYFFPKYTKKIISSFFPLDSNNSDIVLVSPIIKDMKKNKTDNNFILIYFSPYSDSENYDKVINVITKIKDIKFKIYTKFYKKFRKIYKNDNISFSDYCDNFKNDLTSCSALITTGGHQLISEAVFLEVPLFVIPLDTYEQNYNALMVKKYKLGIVEKITYSNVLNFIKSREVIRNEIKKFKKKYYKNSWKKEFMEVLEDISKK